MKNALNWFEIPVADMDRAVRFYERAFDRGLKRESFGGEPMAIFAAAEHGVTGTLVARPGRRPSSEGSLLYLDTDGKMVDVLGRVVAAGGAVVTPRTAIGPHGWMAHIRDSEGNVVGLHEEV